MRPRTRLPDRRDLEIERLKQRLREARERERSVRAEERERFSLLSAASKRFAASMRSRLDEKQRQQRRLDAQYAVSRILEESRDLAEAAPRVFRVLGEQLGWEAGALWTVRGDALRCAGNWRSRGATPGGFEAACRGAGFPRGAGLPGRVWRREEPCWVEDVKEDEDRLHREAAAGDGLRCVLAFPIQDGGRLVGVFEFLKREASPVDEDLLRVAYLVGHQIGQFVERRRAEGERDRALAREREARRRSDTVLESINDAFVAIDRGWRFTYVNRRAEEFWGRSRGELLGRDVWEEFPQAAYSRLEQTLRRAMHDDETAGVETVSATTGAWLSVRAYPSAEGVSVYFQDITARKRAAAEREEMRREAEAGQARLEAVLRQMPGGVFIADRGGRIFLANETAASIYGRGIHSVDECGRCSLSYPDGEPIPADEQSMTRALAGETTSRDHYVLRPDGTRGVVSSNAAPVLDDRGNVVAAVEAFQDVTELREARRTIEESEKRYRTLTANIPGAVFRCVPEGGRPVMRFVSERIEEITGHPAAEFVGDRALPYEDVIHPEDRPHNYRGAEDALKAGRPYALEYRVLHADGGIRWVNERGSGVYAEARNLLWVDGAIFDVTERKEAAQQRDRLLAREWVASAQAAERERISRELHDRVAHSMAVAHQSLQLHAVLAERDAARAADKLDLAREMTKTSLDTTRDLSAELRSQEAEEGLETELRHLLDVAVPPGVRSGLTIKGDESPVPGYVRGQLFLVLREAVRNAVAHSGCGALSVEVEVDAAEVVGRVADDGRGFDTNNGHADGHSHGDGDGRGGVGLRSMRERAALLDGALELGGEPGRGTRVVVTVPLKGGR